MLSLYLLEVSVDVRVFVIGLNQISSFSLIQHGESGFV